MSGITNLMNIALILCPLISIIFGTMYFYNSRDFIELLLAQPIKRKAIILGQYLGLSFRGVSSTNGINYELIFNGNDNEQGVYGSVKSREGNTSRSIFLGTCSHGACTAYRNINNLKLTITFKLKNGQDLVKRYKVKY